MPDNRSHIDQTTIIDLHTAAYGTFRDKMAVVPNDHETGYAYPACNARVVADDDIVADRRVRQDVDVVFNASLLGDGHILPPPSSSVAMRETLAVGCTMVSNLSRGPHLGDNGRI